MRIQGPRDFDKAEPQGARGQKPSANGAAEKAQATGATVVLSPQASRATQVSEANEKKFLDRIAELKAAIEAGTYKVDTQRLADSIVAQELVK